MDGTSIALNAWIIGSTACACAMQARAWSVADSRPAAMASTSDGSGSRSGDAAAGPGTRPATAGRVAMLNVR
jgi:hypothetical protein